MSEDQREETKAREMPVLIVDDDAGIRQSYTKMLERAGYVVSSVGDALAAFDEMQRISFGAVLCDIQMPGLSGMSFFEQLEGRLPQMASRVVFFSGFVDQHETQEFLRRRRRWRASVRRSPPRQRPSSKNGTHRHRWATSL